MCAPTNIAVQEVLRRLLDRLGAEHRCQVVLVATQDRAGIPWSDLRGDDARLSGVLLDHRKKRVKRIARFWLGEGFGKAKPYLQQPPWAYEAGNSCFALLVSDPVQAFACWHSSKGGKGGKGKEKPGQDAVQVVRLLDFVHRKLKDILNTVQDQEVELCSEVAFATQEFSPFMCSRQERRRLSAEAEVFRTLQALRDQLELFKQKLAELLELWEPEASASSEWVEVPPRSPRKGVAAAAAGSEEGGAVGESVGSAGIARDMAQMAQDRKRAYALVDWVVNHEADAKAKALEALIELLGLDASPIAPTPATSEEALAAAEKRLKVLLHPDKASPDMRLCATAAFQNQELAMEAVRKSLKCPVPGTAQNERTQDAQDVEPSRSFEINVDARLRTMLSQQTLDALDAASAVHVELLHACMAVRTAQSSFLKGALLRRAALVFCTLTVAGRSSICGQQIPTVLIDEACQACEAETLVALRSWVQRLFLVGDPRQLPATVSSTLAKRAGYARSMWPG